MEYQGQHEQDLYIDRLFDEYTGGCFVDVGAHDGVSLSNTVFFEKNRNWYGVNVEPNPTVYKKLVENRPGSVNLECAIWTKDGATDFLQLEGYTEMLSGIVGEYDERHLARIETELKHSGGTKRVITVETKRLDTICSEFGFKHINYLSIDAEGGEFAVIKSLNFDEVYVDAISFSNNYKDVSDKIIDYLHTKGFVLKINKGDVIMVHGSSPIGCTKKSLIVVPNTLASVGL